MLDLVVRSALERGDELKTLKQNAQEAYAQLIDRQRLPGMGDLEANLTSTLRGFVPDAAIQLSWQEVPELEVPQPQVDVRLIEDGYPCEVEKTGHGLQRAFIVTLLQHLARVRVECGEGVSTEHQQPEAAGIPDMLLAIEEPELYQHPNRQRHLAELLFNLSHGRIPGVAKRTQILYCTHSPYFVGLDRFEDLRVVRKIQAQDGEPKVTRILSRSFDDVAELIWAACDKQGDRFMGESLAPRLATLLNPWVNEGFFADLVVLVEGEDDRAALLGTARLKKIDFEGNGISIIPCDGKNNVFTAAAIFTKFEIPTFCVWDGDKGKKDADPEENRRLLRLCRQTVEDWPSFVGRNSAAFDVELEASLEREIGEELFNALLADNMKRLNITKKKHALKKPAIIEAILKEAADKGAHCRTMEAIVDAIMAFRTPEKRMAMAEPIPVDHKG